MSEINIWSEWRENNHTIVRKYMHMDAVDKYLIGYCNYGTMSNELKASRDDRECKLWELEEAKRFIDDVIGGHSVVVEEDKGINWFIASCVVFTVSCGLLFIFSRLGGFE